MGKLDFYDLSEGPSRSCGAKATDRFFKRTAASSQLPPGGQMNPPGPLRDLGQTQWNSGAELRYRSGMGRDSLEDK